MKRSDAPTKTEPHTISDLVEPPQPNPLEIKPPNFLSNVNNRMLDLVRNHWDKLNITNVKYLLSLSDDEWESNWDKKYSKKETKSYLKQYRKLLHTILDTNEEEIERTYAMSGNNRLYAKGGISLLERNLRNFIQHEDIMDYDMRNAQPTILLYLTKKANLPYVNLEYYCNNRDEVLSNCDFDGKNYVNYAMFEDKPKKSGNQFIDAMFVEFLNNRDKLIDCYKDNLNPNRKKNDKNPKGSSMSNILCYWECYILNSVIKRFPPKAINTLIFDGFYSTLPIPIENLDEWTKEFGIKWKVKPLDTCYELPDDFNADDPALLPYKEKVKLFERQVCFITFQGSFKVRDEIDGSWKTMTDKQLILKYKNWREVDSNGDDIDFVSKWLKDSFRTDYNRMAFHPYSLEEFNYCHQKEFNIFKGFKAKRLDRKIEDSEVKTFFDHMKLCFGEEKGVQRFIKHYFTHLLQRPHKKIPLILVLRGYEGTGKDTFKEIVMRFMGKDHVFECDGMDDLLERKWNDHLVEKLVCVMNEVKGSDGVKWVEKLKQKITTNDLNVMERFVSSITVKDLNNMIINSNNLCPVIISPTDRRYVLLTTNEDLAGWKDYWNIFYKYLNNENLMNILYTWFLQQEYDETYDWENDRPITEAFRKLASKNISEPHLVLHKLLTEHIEDRGNVKFSVKCSDFNKCCDICSRKVLEKNHPIKKNTIKDLMEKIPSKYIDCKYVASGNSSSKNWIVENPQLLVDRMMRLEFKYFDPTKLDWEQDVESDLEDDCVEDD